MLQSKLEREVANVTHQLNITLGDLYATRSQWVATEIQRLDAVADKEKLRTRLAEAEKARAECREQPRIEGIIPAGPVCRDTEIVWSNGIAFVNARKHEQVVDRMHAGLRECARLLARILAWDQLPHTGDGPYWMHEIDAFLAAHPQFTKES